jgi:hypothetical protein
MQIFGAAANGVVFLAGGGGFDGLSDKRQEVFPSDARLSKLWWVR